MEVSGLIFVQSESQNDLVTLDKSFNGHTSESVVEYLVDRENIFQSTIELFENLFKRYGFNDIQGLFSFFLKLNDAPDQHELT